MEKIKRIIISGIQSERGKDLLTALIVVIVGVGSFGLGRLSLSEDKGHKTVKIEYSELPLVEVEALASTVEASFAPSDKTNKIESAKSVQKPQSSAKAYFASNRGSKYYHPGCTGGKTLKEENKIWFASKEEAEKAGYELSTSCR